MANDSLKQRISDDMKSTMRAKDKERLATLRMLLAAIKQKEIDGKISLDDAGVLSVVEKMIKQRRDSVTQYTAGNRPELAAKEQAEIDVLQAYLPEALDDAALDQLIAEAIKTSQATQMRDMGKVMAALKGQIQGRADMAVVSAKVKDKLA